MNFKKGFNIKPLKVLKTGEVFFTDGTTPVQANQVACEAYGYTYDKELGICKSFIYDTQLERNIHKSTNKLSGSNNETQKTDNSIVTGANNRTLGRNSNSIIAGEENIIDHKKNNGLLVGKMGKITHDSEFCIGGGSFNSEAGLTQYSVLQVSGKTTSTSDVDLYIEGNDVLQNEILLPANSVTTYEIWLSGLVTGGSSGTPGDYETYEYHGTIRCGNTGTLTHNAKIARLLGRTGSLGTKTIDTATAYTLKIQIAGQNNVNTSWHAVVKLHINKTNAVTF